MPTIFRTMLPDESGGRPKIGSTTDEPGLGARVFPDRIQDVTPDSIGRVVPGTGGMSVSPSIAAMPRFLVPTRFKHLNRHARGPDELMVWSFGEGDFEASKITDSLNLRIDPKNTNHGLVEPAIGMPIGEFQTRLAETQSKWRKEG